jgi:hypothetical protein
MLLGHYGNPAERQRLVCRGVVVGDNETLMHHHITEASSIELEDKPEENNNARALGEIAVIIVFSKYTTAVVTVPRDIAVSDVLQYAMRRREEWKMALRAVEQLNRMQIEPWNLNHTP